MVLVSPALLVLPSVGSEEGSASSSFSFSSLSGVEDVRTGVTNNCFVIMESFSKVVRNERTDVYALPGEKEDKEGTRVTNVDGGSDSLQPPLKSVVRGVVCISFTGDEGIILSTVSIF